jgi:hypothetical protein
MTAPLGSGMLWSFGPDGKRSPNISCGNAMGGLFVLVGGFSFPTGAAFNGPQWVSHCGVGTTPAYGHPELAKQFSAVLVGGRLEYRNLANIEKIHNDAAATLLQEQKAKAEQKSPF